MSIYSSSAMCKRINTYVGAAFILAGYQLLSQEGSGKLSRTTLVVFILCQHAIEVFFHLFPGFAKNGNFDQFWSKISRTYAWDNKLNQKRFQICHLFKNAKKLKSIFPPKTVGGDFCVMASPLGRRRRRRWRTSLPETAQDFRRRHLLRVVATQPRLV